ncbi:MAG: serine hydrolase [Anaerolineae bacterium]|nr:serine hydrolase [Anaerolineae bacterium]
MKGSNLNVKFLSLGLVVILVAGCTQATAIPTRTPTHSPTPKPTPTLTWTPKPTLTPTPTLTSTPTPTFTPTPSPTPTPIPFWDTRTSTPEEQGVDSMVLVRMFDYIAAQEAEVHSVIIVRNGYLVTEAYYHPYNQDRAHRLTSCTKSFLSALVGIAVKEGLLDLDAKALDFFPGYTIANDSPLKREITVEHLLLMRSGLDWPESSVSYSSGNNILRQMMNSQDWVQFVLDRPMVVAPGSVFNYSTGDSQILGAVLKQATGVTIQDFARTRLFEPLHILPRQWYWTSTPEGVAFAGGGLHLTPRAMARFGYLYLKGGTWNGKRIVPAEWIEASVAPPTYGYHWWRLSNGGYAALGYGGQRVAVVPSLNLIVVITGDFPGTTSRYLVDAFVVPAARSSEPLPANPEALALLESRIGEAGQP